MPSDPRVPEVVDMLARPIERYRVSLAATLEELRGHLAADHTDAGARAERVKGQLGPFAAGRIDAARLAAVLVDGHAFDPLTLQRLERVSAVLHDLISRGGELFEVAVAPGEDLVACIAARLATIGRAFAAARLATAHTRAGTTGLDEEDALLHFPFARWNDAERRLAPPLVVSVNGADLLVGGVAAFVDGGQKLVLVVDGPCPPAALVRLITPGVLVVQAHETRALAPLEEWNGPALGAVVPPSAIQFVHHPAAGADLCERLSVQPFAAPVLERVGGLSAAQQSEEVRLLAELAARPSSLPGPHAAATAGAQTLISATVASERLTAWLLQQSASWPAAPGE